MEQHYQRAYTVTLLCQDTIFITIVIPFQKLRESKEFPELEYIISQYVQILVIKNEFAIIFIQF